ncbi:MAG: type IV pilus secretin PilQ [Myxococcota bacterium]|nr:type IV pilus secretin PilQ [Myxococcota bacterium]
MRGAKSLVYAALLKRGVAALAASGGPSALLLYASFASAAEATAINHVTDVRVHADEVVSGGATIEVVGSGTPVYSARVADGGRHLLVDLVDSDTAGAPAAITAAVGPVLGVLTQPYDTAQGRMTRLTINLKAGARYRITRDGTTLRIAIAPEAAAQTLPKTPIAPPVVPSSGTSSARASPSVRDVRFERVAAGAGVCVPDGCDQVIVDVDAMPAYALTTTPAGQLRLELRATGLPPGLARTVDVSAYRGALKTITATHDEASGATVIELERTSDATGTISVVEGSLVWSFSTPRSLTKPLPVAPVHLDGRAVGKDGGAVRRVVTVAREDRPKDLPRIDSSIHDGDGDVDVETAEGGAAGFASSAGNPLAQQRYNGRRIDIDLKDADIHNVLRLLADTGHVNVVTADDVAGTITIRMRNVPWDQVLDVVLQAKGLGMVRQGNLIRVAPMAQLQKERELKLAQQKQEYELTPLETRLIPISYAQADELQARAKELLSPRGSIAVDERTNVLIARDVAGNLNYIEELIRSLDTQTAQVLIEARIVEATSKYLRDVGIQWGGDVTFGPATGNPTGVAFPSSTSVTGGNSDNNTPTAGLSPFQRAVSNPNFAVNLPAAVGTGAGGALGMTFGSIDNTLNLSVRLSAAESSGLVRIVSAPRIMVLDNREARINQGTLIPFSQVSALGVQTTFQEAKLQLLVRPHVTADGSVSMHVKLNRDEPDFNQTSARGDPTILKREAETDLLVMDGHTAVIGGIYTRNTGRNLDQVPFFGDIPIIGILFQRRRASDTRNELVIFITPRIVNRSEALGR